MNRRYFTILLALVFTFTVHGADKGEKLLLQNDQILRELQFDGQVWKTTRIARSDSSASLATESDELLVLNLNGTAVTIDAYNASADPILATDPISKERTVTIAYTLKLGDKIAGPVPSRIWIRYSLSTDGYLRKTITLNLPKDAAIDRLEVERFSV